MKRLLGLLCLLALVAAACSDDDDKSGGDDAQTTTTAEAVTTTTTEAPGTTSTTEAERGDPAEIAQAWVAAIAAGDDAGAMALTSPRSMEAIGGEPGWQEMEIGLAEGWGAWGNSPAAEVVVADITAGVWAATFHGEVSQEGPPEESWSTLVVVETGDGLRVEPFLDLGKVELDPETGSSIEPTHEFSAYAFGGREVTLLVDGVVIDSESESADGDQQRVFGAQTLDPGLHGFAVVLWNDTGVMARSGVYTVPND